MELWCILIACVCCIIITAVLAKISPKTIKQIKCLGEDKELNEFTNSLPNNEEVCESMLEMINNKEVKVQVSNQNSQNASLYIVANNSILISSKKESFTRIQTIAHECLHSIQDKKLLWFNFIFSNIYIIYFIVITILSLFNKLPNTNVFAIILIFMSVIVYFVRSFLETDAMTKAKFLAREYMQCNKDKITQDNIDIVVKNYDKLNDIGIVFTNFTLICQYLVKVIIFCIVSII